MQDWPSQLFWAPIYFWEKNSFSPLQLGFSCFSSQDEQFWEQGLKAGSCSPCTLQNQNSSLLLFILFLSSLHFAANETWKTPSVLCRFLVEMCTASLLPPALLPLYGSAAMINTRLRWPPAGGCPSPLLWGGIHLWTCSKRKGRHHSFSFFVCLFLIAILQQNGGWTSWILIRSSPFWAWIQGY